MDMLLKGYIANLQATLPHMKIADLNDKDALFDEAARTVVQSQS